MNVRKAQKHMQRARELLNPESQLGFGAGDDKRERAYKRAIFVCTRSILDIQSIFPSYCHTHFPCMHHFTSHMA